jgi:hypothetical protein
MVSNFPRLFVAPDAITEEPQTEGLGERVLDRVREAFCALHGHDNLMQFQQERMFLKCASCGHESPGWELNRTPPTVVARVDRQAQVPSQLVSERRIA